MGSRLLAVLLGTLIGCGLVVGALAFQRIDGSGTGAVPRSVLAADTASEVEDGHLELVLDGSIWPGRYDAQLRNTGPEAVLLVLPGDGSEHGRRTPRLTWDIRAEGGDGDKVERGGGMVCGNINPLRADELVVLEPGEAVAFDVVRPYFPGTGTFHATLTYTNDPRAEWKGIVGGQHALGGIEAVRRSTACSVVSNRVRIVRE